MAKHGLIAVFTFGVCLTLSLSITVAQTTLQGTSSNTPAVVPATPPVTAPATPLSETEKAFYQLILGPWAQITPNARKPVSNDQLTVAVVQCRAVRSIDFDMVVSTVPKLVSRKLNRVIIYQKLTTGLTRIDFGSRKTILFPKLRPGKITGGKPGYEISNKRGKIILAFAKLKKGNRTTPVMIEGKALFLKCPVKKK